MTDSEPRLPPITTAPPEPQDEPSGSGERAESEADTAPDRAIRVLLGVLVERIDDYAAELRVIKAELAEQPGQGDAAAQARLADQQERMVPAMSDAVAELLQSEFNAGNASPARTVALITQVNGTEQDLKLARKRYGPRWDRAWERFKLVMTAMYSLISRLLKPREWTLSGQLRSDPFGLASASVSITFGAG